MVPNLIVIGAQKCGTTSLHYYLSLHPDITMTANKELEYFVTERNWGRGKKWYLSHFKKCKTRVCGEASPNYTNWPRFDGVAGRMHALLPDCRLIYILRDPVRRMVSQYVHDFSDLREGRPVEAALLDERENPYVRRSRYAMQLKEFLRYYPMSRVHVMTLEDLIARPGEAMRGVFRFLGVDEGFYDERYKVRTHRGSVKRRKNRAGAVLKWLSKTRPADLVPTHVRKAVGLVVLYPFSRPIPAPELGPGVRERLAERVRDDIEELRAMTGQGFEGWSV